MVLRGHDAYASNICNLEAASISPLFSSCPDGDVVRVGFRVFRGFEGRVVLERGGFVWLSRRAKARGGKTLEKSTVLSACFISM